MSKKKKKMVEWQQEQQAAQEQPKREDIEKAFAKQRSKRPIITSSHR